MPIWQLSDGELAASLARREAEARRLYAERLTLVAEAAHRGLAGSLGYRDEATLLAELLNLAPMRRSDGLPTPPLL